jgi:general secretion pathway protein L
MLQGLHLDRAINLLQGPYSQREDLARAWRPWRATAALALAWVLLAGAWHGVEAFKLGRELRAQDQQNDERYQQLFPADSRIVDLPAQLSRQLDQLKGSGGHGGMLALVQVLGSALGAVHGLTLQNLQYRDGALTADLTATDLQPLEPLRAWFAGQGAARMEVLAANSGAEGGQIRIKLAPGA